MTSQRGPAWYQQLAWILPLIACIVFAVLIAGALSVRQYIWRIHRSEPPATQATNSPAHAPESTASATSGQPITDVAVEASSDATLAMLLPAVANVPGRRLARLLVVGEGKDMFQTLDSALAVCIPGDTIELRTNQPLRVTPVALKAPTDVPLWALTIRSGDGFQPVLQISVGKCLQSQGIPLVLEGLHFVTSPAAGEVIVVSTDSDIHVRRCTQTGLSGAKSIMRVLVQYQRLEAADDDVAGLPVKITIEDCFFRNGFVVCRCNDGQLHVTIRHCLGVNGHCAVASTQGPLKPIAGRLRAYNLDHNTFFQMFKLFDVPLGGDEWSDLRTCPLRIACEDNLIVAREVIGMGVTDFAPDRWGHYIEDSAVALKGTDNVFAGEVLLGLWQRTPDQKYQLLVAANDLQTWNHLWGSHSSMAIQHHYVEMAHAFPAFDNATPLPVTPADIPRMVADMFPAGMSGEVGCNPTRLPKPPQATMLNF